MAEPTVEILTESGTWPCPQGVTEVKVECWGAGAGPDAYFRGSGGGAYARRETVEVSPGEDYPYIVGAGGSGTNTVFAGDSETTTGRSATGNVGAIAQISDGTTYYNGGSGYGAAPGGSGGGGGGGAGSAGTGGNSSTSAGSAGGIPDGGKGGDSGEDGQIPGGGGGTGGAGARGQIRLTYTIPPPRRMWWRYD